MSRFVKCPTVADLAKQPEIVERGGITLQTNGGSFGKFSEEVRLQKPEIKKTPQQSYLIEQGRSFGSGTQVLHHE